MNKAPESPRKALVKGLSALLPSRGAAPPVIAQIAPVGEAQQPTPNRLRIDIIDPNPLQPRHIFQPERLRELAQSIEPNGIIQPLIVRRKGQRYELVAGERRWRAARLAGLTDVPVVIQNTSDDLLLEISLIENIQREDLKPIEVAQAFDRLYREPSLSHA